MFYGHGYGTVVFLYFAMEYEGLAWIQNGAKTAIGVGEKRSFHQAGLIFKGQKLHGVSVFGMNHLAGDQQTGNTHLPADEVNQVLGLDNPLSF